MTAIKHTEGLLHMGPHNCVMGGSAREVKGAMVQGQLFMVCAHEEMQPGELEANASRLVACWNSFDGVATEDIESFLLTGRSILDFTGIGPVMKLKHQRDQLQVLLDGANERCQMLMKVKNDWAYRSRRAEAQRDGLLAAIEAAIECGMVPTSSVKEGGATARVRLVQVADQIRGVIAQIKGDE